MSQGLNKDGGINFKRKTNFGETEVPQEEPQQEEQVVKHSQEKTDRQIKLEAKLKTAKTINYSGFAVNGGSVMTLLFGLNSIISDPNTITLLNSINDMFGLSIDFESVLHNIEAFKMQLIGMFVSIQTMIMGYKDTCQKMKDRDIDSFSEVLSQEMERAGI